ncbi:MAG: CRISPR-associated helicase Cas3' [Rhodobacterales bacterium]|nr:CRISPR-associated helicase Cas3' [Rhodobacterales bacterium]MDX5501584.1 CRISPR-associated helicase Cas3' [Rhodobacterales bacterium]
MTSHRYCAHSGHQPDRSDWQPLPDHLHNVARLAAERGERIGLAATAELTGRLHDLGKYDPAFDRVLQGDRNARVDHSTAGGWLALNRAQPRNRPAAEALAYAVLGHHAGLPDKQDDSAACLNHRITAFEAINPVDPQFATDTAVDLDPVARELAAKCPCPHPGFNLSLAVRMTFSCLVDADFRDTEAFYARLDGLEKPRDWPALADVLPDLVARFDACMARFPAQTPLNQRRQRILSHVRAGAEMAPGLFTLTVPTGGGKTLASMGFALDHALRHGHRRIIHAIPYSSITQQTADTFRGIFGDLVLEHHSSVSDDGSAPERRDKLRLAMEDWAAPIVVTTNVQLFESLFSARPSRTRKLHNIAGSVIILDEAQCLPRKLLLPTLCIIESLSAHYGCSVVLCTATQPAFDSRQLKAGGLALEGRELAPDPEGLARELRRARIVQGGEMTDKALIAALGETPQGFVIVNSRAHALELFNAAKAAGVDDLIHLTTRQYPADRRTQIAGIRQRLKDGAPCRLIATSLIEAGVDLDFPVGWRAEAGLDSCVQAAGRVNREGRRPPENSILTVFSAPGRAVPAEIRALADAMRSTARRHGDLLSPEAMRDWFEHVYGRMGDKRLDAEGILGKLMLARTGHTEFAFRSIAAAYRMIDDTMVPVIVPGDEIAKDEIDRLGVEAISSGGLARALQPYMVQIPAKAREILRRNGKGGFASPELRAEQFFVLHDQSLYRPESGLWWEGADYIDACIF